ncbi:MAG: YihY/virulence factor BrkB family protein [Chloroflexi bacterium]|nr:YihY/virulence factor BrkB family protein [Chloroflexota bacterium]
MANFVEDRGTHLSAAISYYGLFALFPLTLLAASVFGIVLRAATVRERVVDQLFTQLPLNPSNAETVREALSNAAALGPTLSIVSLFGALWTAGALSAAIRSALNQIFEVPRGRPLLRGKLFDYVLLPIISLPFVGGLILTTVWRIAQRQVEEIAFLRGQALWLWELGAFLIPLGLSFAAFLLLYWLVPNREVRVRYAWPGALVAALLFEGLKVGFAFYLANLATFDLVYGPLSSVIVLMFWVYLAANIMLFGAEIASELPHVLHHEGRHGHTNGDDEGNWRRSLLAFARGLVLAGNDETLAAPRDADPPRR